MPGTSQKSGEQEVKAKIEVVASRRVRRQKEAAATAPIAPAGIAPRAASVPSTSGFSPPAWCGTWGDWLPPALLIIDAKLSESAQQGRHTSTWLQFTSFERRRKCRRH